MSLSGAGRMRGSRPWAVALAVAVLALPGVALAGPPVVLVEGRVGPYREAALAIKKHLPDAVFSDPGTPGLDLANASLIVAVGQKSLNLARTQPATVPVVFCMVLGAGKATFAPQVTGVPLESDPVLGLKRLTRIAPRAKRVGVIVNPEANELWLAESHKAATALGLQLVVKSVRSASEVKGAINGLVGGVDALWLPPDPRLFSKEVFAFLLGFSSERKLPLIGFLDSFTQAGALASVSADYTDIGNRAGRLAAQILSQGEGRRIPVPAPVFAPGNLTLNQKTASALGITLSPQVVGEAHQVFQ